MRKHRSAAGSACWRSLRRLFSRSGQFCLASSVPSGCWARCWGIQYARKRVGDGGGDVGHRGWALLRGGLHERHRAAEEAAVAPAVSSQGTSGGVNGMIRVIALCVFRHHDRILVAEGRDSVAGTSFAADRG